jgi:hypothetical protein
MGHISYWSVLIILIGWVIETIKESTETFLEASRVVGLEINAEKMKYMIMSPSSKLRTEPDYKAS